MEHWIWVSFATANRGMGCRLNRSCENDSLRYSRLATNLPVVPQFVPEIFETSPLYFSRGGWAPCFRSDCLMLRSRRVPAKCCAGSSTVANRSEPGGRRVRYILGSGLCRKFRNAEGRQQEGPFSTLDVDRHRVEA